MTAILVANPKGGAGKTTVAVNLAAGLAHQNERVYLWDLDRQRSALTWLSLRPPELPVIRRLDDRDDESGKSLPEYSRVIFDTPAGLHGKNLRHALKLANRVLVPVQPSVFDMAATRDFLDSLLENSTVQRRREFIGIVGVRVSPRTRAAATLEAFLHQYDLPILTYLRETQIYVNSSFLGKSIFDLPPYLSARDIEQWEPLMAWING